ncbi:Serine/threonine kinase, partial [Entophlyctis luteolus]
MSLSGPRNQDYPELIGQDDEDWMTDFDFLRCHSVLSPAAINFRIKHVENKLQIEKKLEAGTDRMFQVLAETSKQNGNGSSLAANISSEKAKRIKVVKEKLNDCKDKVRILSQSLKDYRLMVVGEKDLPDLPDDVDDLCAMVKSAQTKRLRNDSYLVRSDSFVRENVPEVTPNLVSAGSTTDSAVSGVSQGETCWLDLEGGGQICLKLDVSVDAPKRKLNKNTEWDVGREKPVQKVWMVQGHKFVNVRFYFVVKCAVCRDFLVASQGYQCQVCKYVCHKDCQSRVPTKCLSSESTPTPNRSQTLLGANHSPHRFAMVPPAEAVTVAWCAHCGYMLSLLNRESRRCAECGICAHSGCSVLVPDICGVELKLLNAVVPVAEKEREPKRSKDLVGASMMSVSASRMQEVSTPGGAKAGEKPKKSKPRPVGLEDFVFLAVLGKGNFGKVMLAEEKVTGNLFAIKVLKKEFIIASDEIEATRAEKRVFLTVQRFPFLVGLHSCFQTESRLYFVMEFVGGGDLMWHIQQRLFGEDRAKFYVIEVLLAIEHLHKSNIAYRDLKLDNILLTREGHVKVADYGLCKEGMKFGSTT